ncbi:MAG: hypothetical protein ACI9U2_003055 [Bradymonadia bacterium]
MLAAACEPYPNVELHQHSWSQAVKAFTAAWREALAAWVDGGKPRFPQGGWVRYAACGALEPAPAVVQRE